MDISFNLPPALVIGLIISTVLPLLVGLVTTRVTRPGLKAVLLAALAAITGLITELGAAVNAHTTFDAGTALLLALGAFIVAVGLHYGLWKPTGATAAAQSALLTPKDDPAHSNPTAPLDGV